MASVLIISNRVRALGGYRDQIDHSKIQSNSKVDTKFKLYNFMNLLLVFPSNTKKLLANL